jgi:hypothetical protein
MSWISEISILKPSHFNISHYENFIWASRRNSLVTGTIAPIIFSILPYVGKVTFNGQVWWKLAIVTRRRQALTIIYY